MGAKSSNPNTFISISSRRTCFTTDAAIATCTPTPGQVTVGTGRRKREFSHVLTEPPTQPMATLDGNNIDFNDIISPSRVRGWMFKHLLIIY